MKLDLKHQQRYFHQVQNCFLILFCEELASGLANKSNNHNHHHHNINNDNQSNISGGWKIDHCLIEI